MGFLDGLFGKKEEYPALDASSGPGAMVAQYKAKLESLATKTNDRLEAVPTDDGLYVYVGKPPKAFGVFWFKGGEEQNFVAYAKQRGLSQRRMQELSLELGEVYRANQDKPRYSFPVGSHTVVVTPVESFGQEVARVIHEAEA